MEQNLLGISQTVGVPIFTDIHVSYRTVHELVKYKLKSKLKVPRPQHIKQNKEARENFKKNFHSS